MVSVLTQRRSFGRGVIIAPALHRLDPFLGCLLEEDALAIDDMHALPDLDLRFSREGVGILFSAEGPEASLAPLVHIIDDPSFPLRPFRGSPPTFSH